MLIHDVSTILNKLIENFIHLPLEDKEYAIEIIKKQLIETKIKSVSSDGQNALYLIESDWDSIENRFEALKERFNNLSRTYITGCMIAVGDQIPNAIQDSPLRPIDF